MRDAYDVSDAELRLTREEKVALHADPEGATDPHLLKWRLSYGVRAFCNVEIYRWSGERGYRFIGQPSDVELARWLLDTLADFVFGALYEHLIGCLAPKNERRTITRSFVESCCIRINERLIELVERSKQAQTTNGRELVLVKDTAIKAFMKENGIRLRTRCCGGGGNVDEAASAAGRAAGTAQRSAALCPGAPACFVSLARRDERRRTASYAAVEHHKGKPRRRCGDPSSKSSTP